MKIIINLGRGNLYDGCENIVVQLLRDRYCVRQFSGSLPPAPELARLYSRWQLGYRAFYQEQALRIGLLETEGLRYSEDDFQTICRQIPLQLNFWLSNADFAQIERALRTDLQKDEPLQVTIIAANLQLQQLPWHLWQLIEDYPLAEVSFHSLNWQKIEPPPRTRQQVRILAVLGDSSGIDLQQDLTVLKSLPATDLTVLTEPPLTQLNEYLWQPEGWDVLLFSGHSHSEPEAGYIYLNRTENITVTQLKHSLSKAIARGLQIAIFNSCEGMGLAIELADLSIPYTVVMGEPVPDRIAQIFLQYFLSAFAEGKTFTLAVKEARQKLAGWETEYVCASWLPVIWQNPATECLIWSDWLSKSKSSRTKHKYRFAWLGGLAVASLVTVCRSLSWLEPLELQAYDRLVRQRPGETLDPRILVVEITEEDTNRDRYPLTDSALVEAIDLLEQHQPAAIGLDIHRADGTGAAYQELVRRLENNPRLFPVCAYGNTSNSYNPPQGLSPTKLRQQMGFSDLLVDSPPQYLSDRSLSPRFQFGANPKVRRQLLSYDSTFAPTSLKCLTPYSLSFQLAFEYLQQQGVEPLHVTPEQQWQFGQTTLQQMERRFAAYQQLDGSSQITINYRAGKPGNTITLDRLRSGNIEPSWIENRIILLGYTATVAQDYFDTPYGIMPGVWIHAHMASQMISAVENERPLIWALPQWGDWLWVLGWSLATVTILTALTRRSLCWSVLAGVLMIVVSDRVCLLLLVRGGWLPYLPTVLALSIVTAAVIAYRLTKPTHQQLFIS